MKKTRDKNRAKRACEAAKKINEYKGNKLSNKKCINNAQEKASSMDGIALPDVAVS